MAVQIYLGCDLEGQPVEFQYQHEMEGFVKVCKRLWESLHLAEKQYAVIANVRCTNTGRSLTPDIVFITEFGIGVMDLKHYYNRIDCSNPHGTWHAGPIMIKPFQMNPSEKNTVHKYTNPHEQVQEYARCIHSDLIPSKFLPYFNDIQPASAFPKIATAICFTHPQAILSECQDMVRTRYFPGDALAEWETFQVLSPVETPEWATSLRFGMNTGYAGGHLPLKLSLAEIDWLAQKFFMAIPWYDMVRRMRPRPQPYAFLSLTEQGKTVQYFPLLYEEEIIGREGQTCSIVLSGRYTKMSRKHLRLLSTKQGIFLEDIGSTHGTFIDGKRITGQVRLHDLKQTITLGGSKPSPSIPELHIVRKIPPALATKR